MTNYDVYPKVLTVLRLLGEGRTLTSACQETGVGVGVYGKYIKQTDELQVAHDDALQMGHDALADTLLNIHNDATYGSTDSKLAKIMSDNIKWFLTRKSPKKYGDRVVVDVTITADKAITTALDRAKARVAEASTITDAVYTEVLPVALPSSWTDADTKVMDEILAS